MSDVITAASLSSTVRAMERLIRSHIHVIESSSKVVENNDPLKKNLSVISSSIVTMPGSRRKTSAVKDLTKKNEKVVGRCVKRLWLIVRSFVEMECESFSTGHCLRENSLSEDRSHWHDPRQVYRRSDGPNEMEGTCLRRLERGNAYIHIRSEFIIYFLKVLSTSLLQSSKEFDLSTYWNPKVTISNGIGDLKYTTTIFMEYDHTDRAWVYERRRTNGQFFEFMELNKFPFDGQVWSFGRIF